MAGPAGSGALGSDPGLAALSDDGSCATACGCSATASPLGAENASPTTPPRITIGIVLGPIFFVSPSIAATFSLATAGSPSAMIEGEMMFYIGGRVTRATEGQTVFVPRTVPHCFKNCSKRESRVLVMFTPASIEGFFEYGNLPAGTSPTDEILLARFNALAPKYGLEVIGPSPL